MADRSLAPSKIVQRLHCYRSVAYQIEQGLHGDPFYWNGTEGYYNTCWASDMGITLVTKTQIKKRGYRIKRGARPVGSTYFKAPLSRRALLYVLECQAVKIDQPEPADKATEVQHGSIG